LRVNAIREALDRPAGSSTVFLGDAASSAEWSLRERDIIEAAKACVGDLRNAGYRLSDNARELVAAVDALAEAEQGGAGDAAANLAVTSRGLADGLQLPLKLCIDCGQTAMLVDRIEIVYRCPECYAADEIVIKGGADDSDRTGTPTAPTPLGTRPTRGRP
jgi:hypothetical protein